MHWVVAPMILALELENWSEIALLGFGCTTVCTSVTINSPNCHNCYNCPATFPASPLPPFRGCHYICTGGAAPGIPALEHYIGKGAAELVSHCIVNKQMASASSYIISSLLDCDWSIKMPSIIWFGSTSVDMVAAYVNKIIRE